jgi:N-acetylmuramoyl-L-alanine amidase
MQQGTVVTQSGNLNIRNRTSRQAAVIGRAPKGATVNVYGQWQGWDVISYNGVTGYVSGQYIRI